MKLRAGVIFVPLIIALLIIGGGLVGVYTIATGHFPRFDFKKAAPSPTPSAVNNPFPKASPAPASQPPEPQISESNKGEPIKTPSNITGKWVGRYTVSAPDACKGESGAWTANLVDTNGKLSGGFDSDAGGGSVSGSYTAGQVGFSVGGGGSGISFNGSISGNTTSGNFKGQVCDPDKAPQATTGSFFGGKIVQ